MVSAPFAFTNDTDSESNEFVQVICGRMIGTKRPGRHKAKQVRRLALLCCTHISR